MKRSMDASAIAKLRSARSQWSPADAARRPGERMTPPFAADEDFTVMAVGAESFGVARAHRAALTEKLMSRTLAAATMQRTRAPGAADAESLRRWPTIAIM